MSLIRAWSGPFSFPPTDPRCQADIKKLFPARLLPFVMFLLLESNAAAAAAAVLFFPRRQCFVLHYSTDNDCIKRGGI